MASHFSSIGLPLRDRDQFAEYAKLCVEHGASVPVQGGEYRLWELGRGVELWAQLNSEGACIGLNPHFSGSTRTKVLITQFVPREGDTPLDGAVHVWADPSGDEEGDGAYPFVFDLPNAACLNLAPPRIVTAQITGFAHELSAYSDEQAFADAQDQKPAMAPQAFIPIGLFSSNGTTTEPPRAMALFTGRVLEVEYLQNPFPEQPFFHLMLESYGGVYDVVADPEIVQGDITQGGIVLCVCWMSGKVMDE